MGYKDGCILKCLSFLFQRLKSDVISDLDGRLGELLDEFVHEVEKVNQSPTVNGNGMSARP